MPSLKLNDIQCELIICGLRLLLKQDSEFYYFDEDYFKEEFKIIKSLIKDLKDYCYKKGDC